ncbi:hypothetical protein ACOTTU_19185 [Roseobacter sp. EG26]|uniref:hypothetical protein n=1 Tax=Roseobacter sp. EG26 TaxID=3412477 RepID=UPI003CE53A4D
MTSAKNVALWFLRKCRFILLWSLLPIALVSVSWAQETTRFNVASGDDGARIPIKFETLELSANETITIIKIPKTGTITFGSGKPVAQGLQISPNDLSQLYISTEGSLPLGSAAGTFAIEVQYENSTSELSIDFIADWPQIAGNAALSSCLEKVSPVSGQILAQVSVCIFEAAVSLILLDESKHGRLLAGELLWEVVEVGLKANLLSETEELLLRYEDHSGPMSEEFSLMLHRSNGALAAERWNRDDSAGSEVAWKRAESRLKDANLEPLHHRGIYDRNQFEMLILSEWMLLAWESDDAGRAQNFGGRVEKYLDEQSGSLEYVGKHSPVVKIFSNYLNWQIGLGNLDKAETAIRSFSKAVRPNTLYYFAQYVHPGNGDLKDSGFGNYWRSLVNNGHIAKALEFVEFSRKAMGESEANEDKDRFDFLPARVMQFAALFAERNGDDPNYWIEKTKAVNWWSAEDMGHDAYVQLAFQAIEDGRVERAIALLANVEDIPRPPWEIRDAHAEIVARLIHDGKTADGVKYLSNLSHDFRSNADRAPIIEALASVGESRLALTLVAEKVGSGAFSAEKVWAFAVGELSAGNSDSALDAMIFASDVMQLDGDQSYLAKLSKLGGQGTVTK